MAARRARTLPATEPGCASATPPRRSAPPRPVTRWVWRSTADVYPRLLAAGVRVERCYDIEDAETAAPRPRGPASASPVRPPPPGPGCAAAPYRPIRRTRAAEPGAQSSALRAAARPRVPAGRPARGVRRPAAPARRHRAPRPDAAAHRRRVGGHAGRRRDEPRGPALARRRAPRAAARAARRAVRGRRRAPAPRRARRRGVRRLRPPGAARSARRRRQGVRPGRDQGQVHPPLGDRGARPSGGGAAARVQEAVPDLGRPRLVLARRTGCATAGSAPSSSPGGTVTGRWVTNGGRRAADPQGDPPGRGRRPGLAARRRRRRPDGAARAGRDLPRPRPDGGRRAGRATSTSGLRPRASPATAPRPSSPCSAPSTARPPATA